MLLSLKDIEQTLDPLWLKIIYKWLQYLEFPPALEKQKEKNACVLFSFENIKEFVLSCLTSKWI